MADTISIGTPPIAVSIRRSERARRFSLRISNADSTVNLTLPKRAAMNDALDFLHRQEGWLRKNLAARPTLILPKFGGQFLFRGADLQIRHTQGRSVKIAAGAIHVPGDPDRLGARLRGFCKVAARAQLVDNAEFYAYTLGKSLGKITLRDTRSRWGSCSSEGNLMFSWRLIMAPPEVLSYVAAHEVAHMIEMNHSADFWRLVDSLLPEYKSQRRWLKEHGASLYAFRF
ncbi:MAG: M48 family metallopeptidase [Alphaproteobacteria bacterium]|nr:M48 family metallopeptidase [Alphaproteobacteria bacterium]